MIQQILAESAPLLLVFACVMTYQYVQHLRRDLKSARINARTGWRMYDATNRQLCAAQGKPVPQPYFPEDRATPPQPLEPIRFKPGDAGPTAINDRERRREKQDAKEREPKFAHPGVLTGQPPPNDRIRAAARAAVADEEFLSETNPN